jgi:16S rRNA (cytosine1402-N4)-methyltransferase
MHEPVLRREVLALLAPQPGHAVVDCTAGGGGHAEALLEATAPDGPLLGIDRDPAALRVAGERLARFGPRVRLVEGDYADLGRHLQAAGFPPPRAVLADCGLSTLQLDDPTRGFSLLRDGPLDMRFSLQASVTAADLVNGEREESLADLFYQLGEERSSRRIARRIVERRTARPFETTTDLADTVARAVGGRWGRIHPATRVFQALRIAVNGELESLDRLLEMAPSVLMPGTRLAIIAFHSLEDRRVKRSFRAGSEAGTWRLVTKKPVSPSRAEELENPRSRSAKLRVVERL